MLRLVGPEPEDEQPTTTDDPGLVGLLERFTLGSRCTDGKYILRPDDATLLKWGMKGIVLTGLDLQAIEAWLREYDPYQSDHGDVGLEARLARLDEYVDGELARVDNPAWIKKPLVAFEAMVRDARRERGAVTTPRVARAVFVALRTVRAARNAATGTTG